tara:strand:- start:16308 stop:17120 length:813 start_codon:yes stop_codon:yes gene_type:complete
MKLHTSKRWYLHLAYYRLLKISRFFTNHLFGKKDHKFLFILTPPYCGSTLLNQILSTSNNLSCNNHLGVREGQLLPEVKDIMFNNKGWHSEVNYPWVMIKNVWMRYWDQRKSILMDKSNTNIMRVSEIKKVFDNIYFLAMVRNPYAQAEGIIRRNGATAEYAAEFALKCLRYQKINKENEKDILFISYEELCDNTQSSIEKIKSFVPGLGNLRSDIEFSAHNFKTDGKMRIQNLNLEKITKLSSEQMQVINSYFSKEQELLTYFGYSIIK